MLKDINFSIKSMNESLKTTKKLKNRALGNLVDQSHRYHNLILCNIVLIQRWWRGTKQKVFFKTLLRKDLLRWKEKHARKIIKMEMSIQ